MSTPPRSVRIFSADGATYYPPATPLSATIANEGIYTQVSRTTWLSHEVAVGTYLSDDGEPLFEPEEQAIAINGQVLPAVDVTVLSTAVEQRMQTSIMSA